MGGIPGGIQQEGHTWRHYLPKKQEKRHTGRHMPYIHQRDTQGGICSYIHPVMYTREAYALIYTRVYSRRKRPLRSVLPVLWEERDLCAVVFMFFEREEYSAQTSLLLWEGGGNSAQTALSYCVRRVMRRRLLAVVPALCQKRQA